MNNEISVSENLPVLDFGREEIDIQVATARRYPRSMTIFRARMDIAISDPGVAESCNYALPRAGKLIEGPSVRLAEIAAQNWGNVRVSARPVGEDDKNVYSEGVAWDLETNFAGHVRRARRITGKSGRYNDDMIAMTINANTSIAYRESVFKVIPRQIINEYWLKSRAVASGATDEKRFTKRRKEMLEFFTWRGVKAEHILKKLELKSIDEITPDHLSILIGLTNAIESGEVTPQEAFDIVQTPPDTGGERRSFANLIPKDDPLTKPKADPPAKRRPGRPPKNPTPADDARTANELAESESPPPDLDSPATEEQIAMVKRLQEKAGIGDQEFSEMLVDDLEIGDAPESWSRAEAVKIVEYLEHFKAEATAEFKMDETVFDAALRRIAKTTSVEGFNAQVREVRPMQMGAKQREELEKVITHQAVEKALNWNGAEFVK